MTQAFEIPSSNATVSVKVIDTTLQISCDADAFIQPSPADADDILQMKTICFLIETHDKTKRILFDCGSRKDPWQGSPYTRKMLQDHVRAFDISKTVDEVLHDAGFDLTSLDAIVWSHWHWDHIGDSSRFPRSTKLVVGPGFNKAFTPGWPKNPEGVLLDADVNDRELVEPTYLLDIGGFRAHDYFGDGSFYLLDVPGHALGHICGLARTTSTTFAFLGGDCCHFAGIFRTAESLHLYSSYACSVGPAPDETFTSHRYSIASGAKSAYCDPVTAQESVEKLKAFDADPDIFLCLAHDSILLDILPLFNSSPERDINDWREQGYKQRAYWGFLKQISESDTLKSPLGRMNKKKEIEQSINKILSS